MLFSRRDRAGLLQDVRSSDQDHGDGGTGQAAAAGAAGTQGSLIDPQSKELTRGPPELVQHFRLWEEFTSAQERCMS
jgi:hypothetical protein